MSQLDPAAIVQYLTVAAVGGGLSLWAKSIAAEKSSEVHERAQEKEILRVEVLHKERLAEFKAEHAREIGEIRGALNAFMVEARAVLTRLGDEVGSVDAKLDKLSVAIIGIDGRNGLRGEVKALATDQRALRERVLALDLARPTREAR